MRKLVLVVAAVTLPAALAVGCKKKQDQPPPGYAQPGYQQQPGYPQQQQPGYPQQQPTPQPGYPQQPAPAATPAAPAATLSQPGPLAQACQTDANCFVYKCHPQLLKCVMPCATNNDCSAGNQCIVGTGLCVPNLAPGATPPPAQ
jgi:hypothetical protein